VLKRLDVRLAFWYTATFLAIIVVLFGFLDYRFRRNLLRETDRMLVDEAREIVSEVRKEPQATALPLQEYEKAVSLRKYYRIAFQVTDRTGTPLYTSSLLRGFAFPGKSFADLLPDQPVTENVRVHGRGSPFRVCTYAHGKQGETLYVVQIATYLRRMEKNIRNFREVLFIAFLLAFLFGSLGGWFLSRRSLRPIGRLTRTTTRITAACLNERLPLRDSGDELDCLAMTINQMIARLEASFQRLTQFTGDAAHELRTPVAALRGEAEVLLSRTRTAEEYREALSNSLERLDFLTKLINDLLFLSQADEGKDATQFETVNLTHTLHELWEAFGVVAEQKNIRFEFQGPSQALISGDRTRLTQLFSNLMDNAIKYTPAGGSIALSLTLDAGRAITTLQDTGIGIPAEDLPLLFDRFYRVDKSRSRESGGTGLGLSICQQIVRTHHGTIQVKSTPNKGTTVIVTLPA
jgi:heavy metal sensor kinase